MQGYASVRVMDASCPMEKVHPAQEPADAHADHGMDASHDMAGMSHHLAHHGQEAAHPDAPVPGDSTTHCSDHMGCHAFGSAALPLQLTLVLEQFAQQAPPAASADFHSHTSLLLWRPPAPL